jgi:hypothetical protein
MALPSNCAASRVVPSNPVKDILFGTPASTIDIAKEKINDHI